MSTVAFTGSAGGAPAAAPAMVQSGEHLEGLPLTVYGHSIAVGQGAAGNASWVSRLAYRHDLAVSNRAMAGDTSAQTVGRLVGTTGTAWQPATGVVAVQAALNDARRFGATPAALNGYSNDLRAMLTALSAYTRREEGDAAFFNYSGAWGSTPYPHASGGGLRYTSTVGAWVDVAFTGDRLDLLLWALAGESPRVFFTEPDGTVIRSRTYTDVGTGVEVNATPLVESFTGYGPGVHTIRMYHDEGAGSIYVDAQLPRSTTPPQVLVVKDSGGIAWAGYPPFDRGSEAALAAYDDATGRVVAEFPNTVAVTVDGWDPATMIGADCVHPNERGHARIAAAVDEALQDAVPDYRAGVNSR